MVTFNVTEHDLDFTTKYNVGDRIAQLVIMPVPLAQYVEVNELSETERNTSGYGSTGN
jgi:dUTP pyrophosphatase